MLDLRLYHDDVRRVFYRYFAARVGGMGLDPEDVLQDVYRSLIARNRGEHPYDPRRSSTSHYIYLVCGSVWSHAKVRQQRLRAWETLATLAIHGDQPEWQLPDDEARRPDRIVAELDEVEHLAVWSSEAQSRPVGTVEAWRRCACSECEIDQTNEKQGTTVPFECDGESKSG